MKRICILTATRAEYGLLQPVVQKLLKDKFFDIRVVVTGAHLSPEFGLTYREIEKDAIPIDQKIEILLDSDTPSAISKTMGLALISFASYFAESKPDLLLVLGDRYETLAVCCAAVNQKIPIAHIHGGEVTEGAVDDAYRHSITKMSYLHFTSTEVYRNRVIQLGEEASRVFNVGALGVENVINTSLMSKTELEESLNIDLSTRYVIVTYHPVTLSMGSNEIEFSQLLAALETFEELQVIFTKANADTEGRTINSKIDEYVRTHNNSVVFESLGTRRYFSAVKYSCAVIGNSSSGIIEVPSLGIPSINIGDRQKGRVMPNSVINCQPKKNEIIEAIDAVLKSKSPQETGVRECTYGDGETSSLIVKILSDAMKNNSSFELKKQFIDLIPIK